VASGYARCEVCGALDPEPILASPRLDGPLVRCRDCGLVYVGARQADFTFSSTDRQRTQALGDRVTELGIVAPEVEEAERPLRLAADRDRLARLARDGPPGGRLLDVGCATGTFLQVAEGVFDAEGVEPDPGTSEQARAAGRRVTTGTLAELAAAAGFDVITMFHVIEHLDSPRAALERVRALLRPGGIVVIETPTVDCAWFRLAPGHWRQLIPDHYFFFSRPTLERLLRETGFEPLHHRTVGRRVSLRFAADRLRRAGVPGAAALARAATAAGIADRTVYLNPGDIMEVVARAR
jgi:SAM-dependent methyltransferase